MRSIGVYLHIPFCVRKCAYCDFLSAPATRRQQEQYVEALKKEIFNEAEIYDEYEVQTVFFGGGTPSILEAGEIEGILECLQARYKVNTNAEITLELNPGTADFDKLRKLKKIGVNRLSIGLQSADHTELRMLGRIHTYEDFRRTYAQAREAGFANINVDLMSALPGQDVKSWEQTLGKVTALQPEHISAYSLIIEEGTQLHERLDEYPSVPSEEEERRMDQTTKQKLAEAGYHRYEISNYARKGYECRHNCIYWQRGIRHTADYVGFGLGASSTVGNVRWKNTDDMKRYLCALNEDDDGNEQAVRKESAAGYVQAGGKESIKENMQKLSQSDCMEEFVFLGLRMMNGVSKLEFADSFGVRIEEVYRQALHKWERQGMLIQGNDCIRLTDAGIDVSNIVLADFLL